VQIGSVGLDHDDRGTEALAELVCSPRVQLHRYDPGTGRHQVGGQGTATGADV
jgi:hypothetical protein